MCRMQQAAFLTVRNPVICHHGKVGSTCAGHWCYHASKPVPNNQLIDLRDELNYARHEADGPADVNIGPNQIYAQSIDNVRLESYYTVADRGSNPVWYLFLIPLLMNSLSVLSASLSAFAVVPHFTFTTFGTVAHLTFSAFGWYAHFTASFITNNVFLVIIQYPFNLFNCHRGRTGAPTQ